MLEIEQFVVGPLETNCYIVRDTESNEALLVDTGYQDEHVTREINKIGAVNFKYILLTHGHFDHIGAVTYYRELTKAQVVISEGDSDFTENTALNLAFRHFPIEPFKPDKTVIDKSTLQIGKYDIEVMETPGHTRGGVCYIIDDNIFTGDTLMKGFVGRTDFPTSKTADLRKSLKKIANINGNYKLFCGHGEPTTLADEKRTNQYME